MDIIKISKNLLKINMCLEHILHAQFDNTNPDPEWIKAISSLEDGYLNCLTYIEKCKGMKPQSPIYDNKDTKRILKD